MSTLKNNNARLTSALQESTANVEEWKRQLHSYKEENTRLKVGLIELEAGRGRVKSSNIYSIHRLRNNYILILYPSILLKVHDYFSCRQL